MTKHKNKQKKLSPPSPLERVGVRSKKSLGQNFIKADWVTKTMAAFATKYPKATIIEIGPGTGNLTTELLEATKETKQKVIAVEKDHRLITPLNQKFKNEIESGRLKILESDIDLEPFDSLVGTREWILIANIPYYITGNIIKKTLTAKNQPKEVVLMIQKEVAERIAGYEVKESKDTTAFKHSLGSKHTKESLLSLSVKVYGEPVYIKTVSRDLFEPAPKVDSAIIQIKNISRKNFKTPKQEDLFFEIIKKAFAQKRKQLGKKLDIGYDTLTKVGISPTDRAEDIKLESWLKLLEQEKLS